MSRWRLGGWWPVALAGMLVAVVAAGQRARGGLLNWNGQPITPSSVTTNDLTVNGDAGVAGNARIVGTTALGAVTADSFRVFSIDAGNVTVNAHLCTTPACNTNDLFNDGAGTLNIRGPFSGSNNGSVVGTLQASGYVIPSGGLKNTGTAAPCTGTGSVCIDDTGGLEVTNGSGTTVASVSAAGALALALKANITATAVGTCDASTEGDIRRDSTAGGTTGHQTRLCYCTSDGSGSPVYSWFNLVTAAKGNASGCPD